MEVKRISISMIISFKAENKSAKKSFKLQSAGTLCFSKTKITEFRSEITDDLSMRWDWKLQIAFTGIVYSLNRGFRGWRRRRSVISHCKESLEEHGGGGGGLRSKRIWKTKVSAAVHCFAFIRGKRNRMTMKMMLKITQIKS